jgi:hypothetical protein
VSLFYPSETYTHSAKQQILSFQHSLTILALHLFTHLLLTKHHTDTTSLQQACVVPRPIGWISTRSSSGTDNLAPYSQFTNLTFDPPYVMFSSNRTPEGKRKDTVVNAEETGEPYPLSSPSLCPCRGPHRRWDV